MHRSSWTRAVRLLLALSLSLPGFTRVTAAQGAPVTTVAFVLRFPTPRGGDLDAVAPDALPPVLRQPVTLTLRRVTIEQALKVIAARAGLDLSYSRAVVPLSRRVSVEVHDATVAEALRQVLGGVPVELWLAANGKAALVPAAREETAAADSGSIVGRVTDKTTGAPIVGAVVVVQGTSQSGTTGEDGRYRIGAVPAGTFTLRARYLGYAPSAVSLIVTEGQDATANFALERALTQLEEVVTTGTIVPTEVKALPTPITVITADEIEQRHPQSFVDIIRSDIPTSVAWDVTSQPIQTNVSVRGVSSLSVSPMKVFIDGIESASSSIAALDPYSIERVEVVRGPQASAIYGADAAGGVIQIFTKRGSQQIDRPDVNLRAELGILQTPYAESRTALRQHYAGSLRGGTGDVSYSFGGGYTRLADYLPIDDRSRQSTPSFYGGVHYARGIMAVDVSGRYFHNRLPAVLSPSAASTGFAFVAVPLFSVQDWINEAYGARLTLQPTTWWRHEARVGIDRPSVQNVQSRPRLLTPEDTLLSVSEDDFRKISVGYNTSVTATLTPDLNGSLTAGIDHYDFDSHSFFTSQALHTDNTIETVPPGAVSATRSSISNTGYFAQAQAGFRETVYLTAGLRAEDNTAFGRDLSTPVQPRIGLSVVRQVGSTTLKARAAYGRSIRAPLAGFAEGAVSSSQINLPNTLLEPERQRGWDGGIDLIFGGRGALSVSGYSQTADDLIGFVQLAVSPVPTFQSQNIGRVTNRGVEVEASFTAIPSLQVKAQYGYVKSRIEDLGSLTEVNGFVVGDRPDGTPTHTAGGSLTFSPAEWGTTLSTGFSYVGSWRSISPLALFSCLGGTAPCPDSFFETGTLRDFVIDYPSFTKFNATLTQRITERLEGYLAVDNLTNNDAVEQSDLNPVMGRLTAVGVQIRY